jgi:hypothetical protein
MSKSSERKRAEASAQTGADQQVASNKLNMEMARFWQDMARQKQAKETAYLEGKVDPLLESYARTGFAPGERQRMRTMVREDAGRAFTDAERGMRGRMSATGYGSDSPSGVGNYMSMNLARGRGESTGQGLRQVEQAGADRRYQTIGPMMGRAGMFDPMGAASTSYGGSARAIRQPTIKSGFMETLGSSLASGIGSGLGGTIGGFAGGALTGGVGAIPGMPSWMGGGGGGGGQRLTGTRYPSTFVGPTRPGSYRPYPQ